MRLAVLFALLLFAPHAFASDQGPSRAAIEIEAPADHVIVPVTIVADLDEPSERLDALSSTIKSVRAAFSSEQDTNVEAAGTTLSGYRSSKLSFSSGSSSNSAAGLRILSTLSEQSDVFSKTKDIHRILGKVALPEDVQIRIGIAFLGVADPEAYRDSLLKKLRAQLDLTRERLGEPRTIRIRGLDRPVRVSPKSDVKVILHLDYSYDLEM